MIVSNRNGLALLPREVLPAQDAHWLVVPMSGHDRTDAQRWARAIAAMLHDRPAAFRRTDALRTALAARHTWRSAVEQLSLFQPDLADQRRRAGGGDR